MGNGRGGNPNYYGRGPPPLQSQAHHQQYVQRQPQSQPSQYYNQQQLQQQQWLRQNQIAGEVTGASAPLPADGVDSR
jgi:ATP-dependent RNA helicase DDX6/DHH1